MDKALEQKFKDLLSRLQRELLKQKGFKKNGSNFRQFLRDGTCKIINFQKSMFNGDGECRFTINIGLYFQKDMENLCSNFKEYECQIQTRVAGISKRYVGDHWWVLTEATETEKLYAELLVLMQEDILPWLDQFSCRQDAIRAGQAGKLKHMIRGSIYVNI